MKNRLLKTFTSLVLTVLMVLSIMPAFAINIGAEGETYNWTRVTSVDTLKAGGEFIIGYEETENSGIIIPMANTGSATTSATGFMYSGESASSGGKDTLDMNTYNGAGDKYIVTIAKSTVDTGKITIKTAGGYIGNTNTKNNCKLFAEDSAANGTSFTATIGENDVITLNNGNKKYHTFQYNSGSPRFACYGGTQKNLVIYQRTTSTEGGSGSETTTETPACLHTNKVAIGEAKAASCTEGGITAGLKCSDCGTIIEEQRVIPATGHTYKNGKCTVCNQKMPTYTKVDLAEIKATDTIIIVSTKDGVSYAMSNDNGASAAPAAILVTITDGVITTDATNIFWNISNDSNGNLTIYPAGKTDIWLYSTNSNNGIRVGDGDAKTFVMDANSGYLKNTGTTSARYLGVYNKADWRTYTTIHDNIAGQTFSFYKLVDANCTHDNTENIDEVAPTCTTPGKEAGTKCLDCGTIISGCEPIDATGHLHTEEVEAVDATCTTPGANAGVKCTDCGTIISGCETIDATGHKFVNGKCAYNCGATRAVYTKVDDISTLVAGDVIVIYYPSGKLLLSGTASGTKLEGVSATVSNNTVISNNDDELVLIVGKDENGYVYFQTKDGKYLTSTGSNNLTLEDTLTDNAKWYFDTTGKTATLRIVNQNANNQALEYYKGFFTVYTIGDTAAYNFEVYRKAEPVIEGVGLSLNKGVTVKVRYTIPGSWLTANAGAKVVFSNDEKDIKTIDVVAGINVYAVDLTPAQINDALKVKITDEKGNLLVAEKDDVGVSAYKAKAEAAGASKQLIDLLNAALTYSSVADGTYDGKDLTNDFDGVADPTVVHKDDNAKLFEAFSGQLGTYASIYINVNTANVPDGETLILTVGGTKIINGLQIANYITKDGQIVITGLFPANFDDTISIDTTIEGSMAEFTFNSYLKAIYSDSSSKQQIKNLAVATYLYGLAAEAYLDTLK